MAGEPLHQLAGRRIFPAQGLLSCSPEELPPGIRAIYDFDFKEGDRILFLPRSRINAFKISAVLARFLDAIPEKGDSASRLISSFAQSAGLSPSDLLANIYPDLVRLLSHGFLETDATQHSGGDRGSPEIDRPLMAAGWKTLRKITSNFDSASFEAINDDTVGFLKVFPLESEKFRIEISALMKIRELESPAFPRILWSGTFENRSYLVSSWIVGESLSAVVSEFRGGSDRVRLQQRAAISNAIVAAYSELHTIGLLHIDVHPGNILVRKDCAIALCDFEHSSASPASLTRLVGIERFYSPETARQALASLHTVHIDACSEQFSVAAMLFEALTGWPAHATPADSKSLLENIASREAFQLEDRGLMSMPATSQVLAQAMALVPSERHADMQSFAAALSKATASDLRSGFQNIFLDKSILGGYAALSAACVEPTSADSSNLLNGAAGVFLAALINTSERGDVDALSRLRAEIECAIAPTGCEIVAALRDVYRGAGGLHILASKCDQLLGSPVAIPSLREVFGEARFQKFGIMDGPAGLALAGSALWRDEQKLDACVYLLEILHEVQPFRNIKGVAHGAMGTLLALVELVSTLNSRPSDISETLCDLLTTACSTIEKDIEKDEFSSDSLSWSWCSGWAGTLRVVGAAARMFPVFTKQAEVIATSISARRLPQDLSLCCGAAGQAIALWRYGLICRNSAYVRTARVKMREAIATSRSEHAATSLYYGSIGVDAAATLINSQKPDILADLAWLL